MSWVRTDDGMPIHPKIEPLSDAAYRLHSHAIHFCARNETDGFIPADALPGLTRHRNKEPLLKELTSSTGVRPGASPLWAVVPGGWLIHDFLEYNPRHAELDAKRRQARERMTRVRSRDVRANNKENVTRTNHVEGDMTPVSVQDPGDMTPVSVQNERELTVVSSDRRSDIDLARNKTLSGDVRANATRTNAVGSPPPVPIPIPIPERSEEAPTAPAAPPPHVSEILTAVSAHESLRPVATDMFARAIAKQFGTDAIAKGTKLEWVIAAIGEAALTVAGSDGMMAKEIARTVQSYVRNARAPRPEPRSSRTRVQPAVAQPCWQPAQVINADDDSTDPIATTGKP